MSWVSKQEINALHARIAVLEKALNQCFLWAHNTKKVVQIVDAAMNARDPLKLADGAP